MHTSMRARCTHDVDNSVLSMDSVNKKNKSI